MASTAKVPLFGNVAKAVTVNLEATAGAQIGANLLLPDGRVGTLDQLRKLFGSTVINNGKQIDSTDDLEEGRFNWYGNVGTRDVAGTTYTAAQGDNDTILRGIDDAGLVITVPAGAFVPDVTLYALQGAAGAVKFVAGAGVTFLPADSAQTRAKGSLIGLKQTAPDVWEPAGDLAYFAPATTLTGNPTNASAQPVNIALTADGHVLIRRSGVLVSAKVKAGEVVFTPTGNLSSTDVQAALAELDDEKIARSLLTAKGDLIVASAPGVPQRLPRGTLGQVPTVQADGSIAYATPSAGGTAGEILVASGIVPATMLTTTDETDFVYESVHP